jgi:hypothetical protein
MILLAQDVAQVYYRENPCRHYGTGAELVGLVDKFMRDRGLERSSISRVAVAEAVLEMQHQVETPEPAPEFRADVEQGFGDELAMRQADELMLSHQVAGMSMAEFGANRERFGLHRPVVDFLMGR